jgi:hypothetical protein
MLHLKDLLLNYGHVCGLKVSYAKSNLIPVNVDDVEYMVSLKLFIVRSEVCLLLTLGCLSVALSLEKSSSCISCLVPKGDFPLVPCISTMEICSDLSIQLYHLCPLFI